jgi:predicted nucleic-acid-binding protein
VITLETNVLLRFVVKDDELQHRAADRLFQSAVRSAETLYVADAVLCKFCWMLSSRYKLSRFDVASALAAIMQSELIVVEHADAAERALDAFRNGRGGFADY